MYNSSICAIYDPDISFIKYKLNIPSQVNNYTNQTKYFCELKAATTLLNLFQLWQCPNLHSSINFLYCFAYTWSRGIWSLSHWTWSTKWGTPWVPNHYTAQYYTHIMDNLEMPISIQWMSSGEETRVHGGILQSTEEVNPRRTCPF